MGAGFSGKCYEPVGSAGWRKPSSLRGFWSGRISVPLAREGYRVTCLDISPGYVEEALEYARDTGVEDRVEGVVGDAWKVDELVKRSYSAVLVIWTSLIGHKGSPEADIKLL